MRNVLLLLLLFGLAFAANVCGDGLITGDEQCDPRAVPEGCSAGELCCPVCCTCHSLEPVLGFRVPNLPFGMFANENVTVFIDGSPEYHVTVIDHRVADIGRGPHDSATANIYTDMETVRAIHDRELEPLAAVRSGRIRYRGVGFVNSLKSRVVSFFLRFFSR